MAETVQNNGRANSTGRGSGGASGHGWKPGQSGNPGGRPKGLAAAVRETVPAEDLKAYYEAIWRLDKPALKRLGILIKDCTLAERNKAGEWLADRGYGKAPAYAPVEHGDPLDVGIDGSIEDALDELAGKREAKAARESPAPGVAGEGEAAADTAG